MGAAKMLTTKLYHGSVVKLLEENGMDHSCLKAYEYVLRLRAAHPFSFISNYKKRRNAIADEYFVTPRTIDRWVNKSIAAGFARYEGDTLRLLSNTEIKQKFATKKSGKYGYNEILVSIRGICGDLHNAIELAPIQNNINKQYRSIKRKTSSAAKKQAGSQSNFAIVKKNAPNHLHPINEDVMISQKKASELLGYRSQRSGFNALRRLQAWGIVDVRSNMIEITRDDYNARKVLPSQFKRLLIKGRGKQAKFYYCLANTVFVTKPFDTASYKKRVNPRYSMTIAQRYSCITSTFLDNY